MKKWSARCRWSTLLSDFNFTLVPSQCYSPGTSGSEWGKCVRGCVVPEMLMWLWFMSDSCQVRPSGWNFSEQPRPACVCDSVTTHESDLVGRWMCYKVIWHGWNLWHGLNGSYPLFWPCGGTHWTGAVLYSLLQSLALVAQSRLGSSGTTRAGLLPKPSGICSRSNPECGDVKAIFGSSWDQNVFLSTFKIHLCDALNKNSMQKYLFLRNNH